MQALCLTNPLQTKGEDTPIDNEKTCCGDGNTKHSKHITSEHHHNLDDADALLEHVDKVEVHEAQAFGEATALRD